MGFQVITPRNGIFVDGDERTDVVKARKSFLRRMVKLGFLSITNAPTPQSALAIPTDIEPPTSEKREKTIFLFYDETIFHSNEDQNLKWGVKGEKLMKRKSKGAAIMISDFVDEHNGCLEYSDECYENAKKANPSAKKYAREFLEIGENKEGH